MKLLQTFIEKIRDLTSHKEVNPKNKSFFVKDASGQWWFFGIYSNKFKDRDGEIISSEAHQEYVKWLKDTGFKPMLTVHHLPRMPKGFWVKVFEQYENDIPTLQRITDRIYKQFGFARAEYVNYVNGFMTVAGKVFVGKEETASKLAELPGMGMSHGFIVKESSANIFDKYRSFEMSTLRSKKAANYLTASRVAREGESVMKSEKGFDPKDREILTRIFGEQAIADFEVSTEGAEKILSEVVEYKDDFMDTEVVTQEKVEETPASAPETEVDAPVSDDQKETTPVLTVETLAKGLTQTFTELQEVLTSMQKELVSLREGYTKMEKELVSAKAELKEVKQSEDEKVAAMFTPVWNWKAGYSATNATDNLVESKAEKEVLTEKAPEGEKAAGVDMSNPLVGMVWSQILPQGR